MSKPIKDKSSKPEVEAPFASKGKRWYVVRTQSGTELTVKQTLEEWVRRKDMGEQFGEILVPTEKVVEIRAGQKRKSERKFFPGYVLVNMEMNEETWHLVVDNIKGVSFVGGKSQPSPVPDSQVEEILLRVQEGADKPKPKVLFEPGEVIRVADGPFADFNGVVEEVNYEKNRMRVAVLIFGRSTPVDLDFSQVEKA